MAIVESVWDALTLPMFSMWNKIIAAIPDFIGGLIVLAVGYIVAVAFGLLLHKFLEKAKLDEHVRKAGVAHSIGFISISNLAAGVLKWYIFALFLLPAAQVMKLGAISGLLMDFALWIPRLIAGIVMLLLGLIFADYIADRMLHAKRKGVRAFSWAVRWFLIIMISLTALEQIGLNISLATTTTLILIAGVSLGIAIALGIGFGFALKDEAKETIKQVKKGLN